MEKHLANSFQETLTMLCTPIQPFASIVKGICNAIGYGACISLIVKGLLKNRPIKFSVGGADCSTQ